MAVAATEFNAQRDNVFADKDARANEQLGYFAHELRNHLNSATLALTAIKAGSVGLSGATGAVLDRSLVALRGLIDRALAEARMAPGIPVRYRLFSIADSRRSIEANKRTLAVRNLPGSGRVFTIDLPRFLMSEREG